MRRATVDWSLVSSSNDTLPLAVSGRSPAPGVGPAGAAAGWATGAAGPAAAARLTSALTGRPPGPVPDSPARASPRSLAVHPASGEAVTPPSPAGPRGGAGGAPRPAG